MNSTETVIEAMPQMQQYHDLMQNVMTNGYRQSNRTGIDTHVIPGAMMQFDLRQGFPAITTKKLAFKAVKGELIGFMRGYDNAADFRALGCNIWDQNANENQARLNNPQRKGLNDLGRIYGKQWTYWKDTRIVHTHDEAYKLFAAGYEQIASSGSKTGLVLVYQKGINQLEAVLSKLLTDPTDRRMIVNAWRPDEFDQMALPPCHVMYQFIARVETKELHLCMYQRSNDLFLGNSFNIASSALLLEIMARLSGFKAATFTHFMADAHVYQNHFEQVETQLSRDHFPAPTLVLSDNVKQVSVDGVGGAFTRIEPDDILLEGYQSHESIKAPMAV